MSENDMNNIPLDAEELTADQVEKVSGGVQDDQSKTVGVNMVYFNGAHIG